MQNNKFFRKLYSDILKSHYVLIILSKNTSIDSISSALSLSNYFFENKIKHKVLNSKKTLPNKLNFLMRFDKVVNTPPKYYDLIIDMDCDEFNIQAKSSSEVLYSFFKINNLLISKNTAECLYAGIYDYSLGFSYNINSITLDALSSLLECGINVENISNNLLRRESLAKFKCTSKIMSTLELFSEGKLATIYLEDNWSKETGIDYDECNDVLDRVLCIGIVNIVLYFRLYDKKIRVSIVAKNCTLISNILKNLTEVDVINSSTFNVNSINILETKQRVVSSILNCI